MLFRSLSGTAALVNCIAAHHLGEDAAAAATFYLADEDGTVHEHRMLGRYHLWRATGDREHLDAAKEVLDQFVRHAPPDARSSAETNVALHRSVMSDWRAHEGDGR